MIKVLDLLPILANSDARSQRGLVTLQLSGFTPSQWRWKALLVGYSTFVALVSATQAEHRSCAVVQTFSGVTAPRYRCRLGLQVQRRIINVSSPRGNAAVFFLDSLHCNITARRPNVQLIAKKKAYFGLHWWIINQQHSLKYIINICWKVHKWNIKTCCLQGEDTDSLISCSGNVSTCIFMFFFFLNVKMMYGYIFFIKALTRVWLSFLKVETGSFSCAAHISLNF